MMDDTEKGRQIVEIPADVADAWAAVILDLADKANDDSQTVQSMAGL